MGNYCGASGTSFNIDRAQMQLCSVKIRPLPSTDKMNKCKGSNQTWAALRVKKLKITINQASLIY